MSAAAVQGLEKKRAFAVIQADRNFFGIGVSQKIEDKTAVETDVDRLALILDRDFVIALAFFRRRPFQGQFIFGEFEQNSVVPGFEDQDPAQGLQQFLRIDDGRLFGFFGNNGFIVSPGFSKLVVGP